MTRLRNPYADTPMGELRAIETDIERENRELRERLQTVEHEREIERRTVREILGRAP
jgi:hypothetical protein